MKRIATIVLTAMLLAFFIGCAGGGAGSGGGDDGALTTQDIIARINPEQPAQVPESLENGKTGVVSQNSLRFLSSSIVDVSAEEGVFGRIMQDLMYNHLLDLVENPMDDSNARLFMALLKDIAADPSVPFVLDTPIDLGVRTFPGGGTGPNDEPEMDMGTLRITEESASETVVYWSVPYGSGVYYIRLNLIQIGGDDLRFETRMGYQPDGDPLPPMEMSSFDAISTDGGIFKYQWSESETQTFQQYKDSDGMLRTFFNTMVRRTDPVNEYDLLFLMIGDDRCAAIDAYQYDRINPVQRSFEAYNQSGSLISQIFFNQMQPYRYPLKYVTKSGYTLTKDEFGEYWLDSANNDTFDSGMDIDLTNTTGGEVVDYIWDPITYDSQGPWDVGEYSTWVSGLEFAGQSLALLQTSTPVSGLDSASQVSEVEALLDGWIGEIASTIDVSSNDILSFPTNESDFLAALGLPLDPSDFPVP